MERGELNKPHSRLAGLAARVNPLKSFTFVLALGVTALAAWNWFNQPGDPRVPFPFYGAIAASYAAGFLIGRLLWNVVKAAVVAAAIVLGGLALLSGGPGDPSKVKEATHAGTSWVRAKATRAKQYLLHFLPSGGAAGLGVFAGSRPRQWRQAQGCSGSR